MYEIECAAPRREPCPCCGAPQTLLTRFIAADASPLAILQAALPEGPHSGVVDALVSIGTWDGDPTCTRVAGFPLTLTQGPNGTVIDVGAPASTSWASPWGPLLARESAVKHPRFSQVLDVVHAVLAEDTDLTGYLHDNPRP